MTVISSEPPDPKDVPPLDAERQLAQAPRHPSRWSRQAWPAARAVLVCLLAMTLPSLLILLAAIGVDIARPADGRIHPEDIALHPAAQLASCLPAIAVVLLAWRFLDRGTLAQLGHPGPPSRILKGLLLGTLGGIALMAAIVGCGVALGGYRITGPDELGLAWLGWTPVLVLAAYFEELLLRGYILQNLGRLSPMTGVLLSSLLFALLHLGNPHAADQGVFSWIAVAGIFMAGVLLGGLSLWSRDLWLPTGVHFGWNWAQGILFGLPVSGLDLPSLAHGELMQESVLTGARFGPESSLVALVLTTSAAAAVLMAASARSLRLPMDQHDPRALAAPGALTLPSPPEVS